MKPLKLAAAASALTGAAASSIITIGGKKAGLLYGRDYYSIGEILNDFSPTNPDFFNDLSARVSNNLNILLQLHNNKVTLNRTDIIQNLKMLKAFEEGDTAYVNTHYDEIYDIAYELLILANEQQNAENIYNGIAFTEQAEYLLGSNNFIVSNQPDSFSQALVTPQGFENLPILTRFGQNLSYHFFNQIASMSYVSFVIAPSSSNNLFIINSFPSLMSNTSYNISTATPIVERKEIAIDYEQEDCNSGINEVELFPRSKCGENNNNLSSTFNNYAHKNNRDYLIQLLSAVLILKQLIDIYSGYMARADANLRHQGAHPRFNDINPQEYYNLIAALFAYYHANGLDRADPAVEQVVIQGDIHLILDELDQNAAERRAAAALNQSLFLQVLTSDISKSVLLGLLLGAVVTGAVVLSGGLALIPAIACGLATTVSTASLAKYSLFTSNGGDPIRPPVDLVAAMGTV